jgi:hypothetical protein
MMIKRIAAKNNPWVRSLFSGFTFNRRLDFAGQAYLPFPCDATTKAVVVHWWASAFLRG